MYRLLYVGCAHLRTLGINHDTNMWRHSSNILDNGTDSIFCSMCGIHTNHVHARKKQFSDKILIASAIADGSNNLCLFHICNYLIEISMLSWHFCHLSQIFCKDTKKIWNTIHLKYKIYIKYDECNRLKGNQTRPVRAKASHGQCFCPYRATFLTELYFPRYPSLVPSLHQLLPQT